MGTVQTLAERANMPHGITSDKHRVYVTEPLAKRVVILDRETGAELGELPAPADGFKLPFQLRFKGNNRLWVLDPGGFPSPSTPWVPVLHEYAVSGGAGAPTVRLRRSIRVDVAPIGFAEDFEITHDGFFVLSDSVLGALWVIEKDGEVKPGIVPESPMPADAIAHLAGGPWAPVEVDGVEFKLPGDFAPGVGSLAANEHWLYFGSSALGGLRRVRLSVFHDARNPWERAEDIQVVSPKPDNVSHETLKGLAFDPDHPNSLYLYAADPLRGRILRIHRSNGARDVVATDEALLRFPCAADILKGAGKRYVVACDQEHRMAGLNAALTADAFVTPFRVALLDL